MLEILEMLEIFSGDAGDLFGGFLKLYIRVTKKVFWRCWRCWRSWRCLEMSEMCVEILEMLDMWEMCGDLGDVGDVWRSLEIT